jgi:aminoglycoside/choline kinase family phosphotransferase
VFTLQRIRALALRAILRYAPDSQTLERYTPAEKSTDMALQIPVDIDSLTPEWFTQVFINSGTIKYASVTAIDSERLGEGQGYIGQVIRFRLMYSILEEGAPESIIAKISHPDPDLRKMLSDFDLYKREINFYAEIADKIDMSTPHCYYSALDAETGNSVILLEDLQNGRIGDNVSGCSREEAERIIDHLVPLHAAWWEHPELESKDWIPGQPPLNDPDMKEELQQQWNDSWNTFAEKFSGRIPNHTKEAYSIWIQHAEQIRKQSLVPPFTLCHGDYRLDNFFFGHADGNTSFVVFDWQALQRAQGASDLSYFMIWNLESNLRREVEKDLLHEYCAALKKQGVNNYSPEQCFHSYQITLYDIMLPRLVGVGAALDISSDRAQALFSALLARTNQAIIDHPIVDLI